MDDGRGNDMVRTAERIAQAEEGIAQVQTVLDHAQSALEVAGTVESAARRSRRWLKLLLLLGIVGVIALVVIKLTRKSEGPDPSGIDAPDRDRATAP